MGVSDLKAELAKRVRKETKVQWVLKVSPDRPAESVCLDWRVLAVNRASLASASKARQDERECQGKKPFTSSI